jgi:hypothetical protein
MLENLAVYWQAHLTTNTILHITVLQRFRLREQLAVVHSKCSLGGTYVWRSDTEIIFLFL